MVPRDTLGAIPLMTKTLIPIGGLISASSITTTINIPNQTASNPNPLMMGKKTGRVKRIIAMVSRMAPSKIYISKIRSSIPIGGPARTDLGATTFVAVCPRSETEQKPGHSRIAPGAQCHEWVRTGSSRVKQKTSEFERIEDA